MLRWAMKMWRSDSSPNLSENNWSIMLVHYVRKRKKRKSEDSTDWWDSQSQRRQRSRVLCIFEVTFELFTYYFLVVGSALQDQPTGRMWSCTSTAVVGMLEEVEPVEPPTRVVETDSLDEVFLDSIWWVLFRSLPSLLRFNLSDNFHNFKESAAREWLIHKDTQREHRLSLSGSVCYILLIAFLLLLPLHSWQEFCITFTQLFKTFFRG